MTFNLSGKSGLFIAAQETTLQNFPVIWQEASTIEFFGTVVCEAIPASSIIDKKSSPKAYFPLVMLGTGPSGAYTDNGVAGAYNGGLYLYQVAFDGWNWTGPCARWINSDYLQMDRSESANGIGTYNLNSGVVVQQGYPAHIVVTHDGAGHWRLYIDGHCVKDTRQIMQTLYSRPDGGAGADVTVNLLGGMYGTEMKWINGWAYLVGAWKGAALTDAQVLARYTSLTVGGAAYSGPAPTKSYDFRAGSLPADVTTAGSIQPIPAEMLKLAPSSLANDNTHATLAALANGGVRCASTRAANGRVFFEVEPGATYKVRLNADFGTATSLMLRASTSGTDTVTTFYTDTTLGIIDREDTITMPEAGRLYVVGISAVGTGYFDILPGTSIERA